MKSTTSLTVFTGLSLYTQATTALVNPTTQSSGRGVLTNLAQPHDPSQLRLIHQHPSTISNPQPNKVTVTRKQANQAEADTVQGGAVLSLASLPFTDSNQQNKIKTVSATFLIPKSEMPIQGPTSNNPVGVYAASFWVGIDGVTTIPSQTQTQTANETGDVCNPSKSSLRLGVDIFYDGTLGGEQTPFAWYQYLPGLSVGFANFSVAPGDLVRLTAVSPSSSSSDGETGSVSGGTVTIENFGSSNSNDTNVTTRRRRKALQTATYTFPPPTGTGELCQTQASFMVEDFPLAGLPDFPIAFTNFTSIEFGDLKVETTQGESLSLTRKSTKTDVQTLDIYQAPQGGRLTDCDISGRGKSGKVVCKRVVKA